MARELAYVLINPHTLSKSRTGGVIGRYLARMDLSFVAARMFNPPADLAERYAELVRSAPTGRPEINRLIADYIAASYTPNRDTNRPRRAMLLLFEGEEAIEKIWQVTGSATLRQDCGESVRETYGEYITDDDGSVRYFEPAVLVAPDVERARHTLRLWAEYSDACGGLVESSSPYPEGDVQRTLVLLKPDNFRFPSLRPGSIIDVLSRSGLRIVGVKKVRMTVAQAERFYGPVRDVLAGKFPDIGAARAKRVLESEFGFPFPDDDVRRFCGEIGRHFADEQFESIVEFMTGFCPRLVPEQDKAVTARQECLALVYEGVDAVGKIRDILGATDPSKAQPGSVRREFGSNIMVNAAHASDSPENAARELEIVNMEEETLRPWIEEYYGRNTGGGGKA
jgi:nucleoside diphosphate kinase